MAALQDGKFRKKTSFAMVSNVALRDKTLSLKAKGLYAFIQSYITLDDFALYKSFIFNMHENDGVKTINGAWKELKERGYLKQFRIRTVEDGKSAFRYEYELLDEPDMTTPATINVKLDGTIADIEVLDESDSEKNESSEAELPSRPTAKKPEPEEPEEKELEYEAVKNEVSKRLGIDGLEERKDYAFPSQLLDLEWCISIRDIIVEVLLSNDKKVRIGKDLKNGDEVRATFAKFDYNHLNYIEENLQSVSSEVTYPKEYLLTTIYNAVKTYGVANRGLISLRE